MPEFCSPKKGAIDLAVSRYCLVRNGKVVLNDKLLYEEDRSTDFPSFIRSLYKKDGSDYRKFFKMDRLSKLGFLTADILLEKGQHKPDLKDEEIAIVISNSQSSLETDARFLETIPDKANYFPNPALFVYTLPNLMVGELCIRYRIKGENIFFISQKPDFDFLHGYVTNMLQFTAMKAAITGWVDLDMQLNYEAVLFLVEERNCSSADDQRLPFHSKTMEELYCKQYMRE